VVQLVGDANDQTLLAKRGGQARIQFDIYAKTKEEATLRISLKDALRRIRGTTGGLDVAAVRIVNDMSGGLQPGGAWRWTVEAEVEYFEP
jgi:hypothetical protein